MPHPCPPHPPVPPQAAKRRAVTELLFFASVGDMRRCQRIVRIWNLIVSDPTCCDYDRRTPLYVSARDSFFFCKNAAAAAALSFPARARLARHPFTLRVHT